MKCDVYGLLWNMKVHKTAPPTPMLGQFNPVHTLFFPKVLKTLPSSFLTEIITQHL
jgi:hypothetical protein